MKKCTKCGVEKDESEFYSGYPSCKACKRAVVKKYRVENPEKTASTSRANYTANREERQAKSRKYYYENKEKILAQRKTSKRQQEYQKEYRRNPLNRVKNSCRARIRELIREGKEHHTGAYLGCTWSDLKAHLENQFVDGMGWDNYGEWHVDHIVPLSSAKSLEELIPLFHYQNLQPLWAYDNLSKGGQPNS